MSTNEQKHTPGNWTVSVVDTINGDPAMFEITGGGGCVAVINTVLETGQADAELIARAPELLAENEQLRAHNAELVRALKNMLGIFDGDGPSEAQLDYGDDVTACEDARAILAQVQA